MLFQLKKDLTRKGPSKEWIENENLIKEKSYYVTHRKIRTFAFLDDKTKGSNWLQMRRLASFKITTSKLGGKYEIQSHLV